MVAMGGRERIYFIAEKHYVFMGKQEKSF